MKIVMVLTSHDTLGNTGKKTGFWLEELANPYYVFKDAGAEITIASPLGGHPPLDPISDETEYQTASTNRFKSDPDAQALLNNTVKLAKITAQNFDAVFYPGGHGPLWDLVDNPDSIKLIENTYAAGKPVAAICHGPCVLKNTRINGKALVANKNVTCFSNAEESAVALQEVVPFLVEDMLRELEGSFSCAENFTEHYRADGNLITGQNPASSSATAKAVLELLI